MSHWERAEKAAREGAGPVPLKGQLLSPETSLGTKE